MEGASVVASCAGSLMPLIEGAICNFRNGIRFCRTVEAAVFFTLSRLTRRLPVNHQPDRRAALAKACRSLGFCWRFQWSVVNGLNQMLRLQLFRRYLGKKPTVLSQPYLRCPCFAES